MNTKIIRPLLLLVLTAVLLSFGSGCATLPEVSEIMHNVLSAEEPTPLIFSSDGPLSPEKSRELLARLEEKPSDFLDRHLAVMDFVGGGPLIKGNKVTLLTDGAATYTAIFKAVKSARNHINLETYIFEDDETGRKLADLLITKRKQGVQVNIIYDGYGASGTPASFFERLQEGRINVVEFNPINPLKVFAFGSKRVTYRDHRKMLIVDGKTVITGGVNISQVYSSRLSGWKRAKGTPIPWRDTDIQIEGPAVAQFQKLFLDTWSRQDGPPLGKRNFFPRLKEKGNAIVQVVGSTPGEMNRTTFIMYVSAVTFAEKSAYLTNAYFAPDRQTVKALKEAAERGVDVKIIVPGASDLQLALYAGQYYYSDLLESGVKLYQRRNAMLHAKTAVIDDVWSTVGSTNMEFWSFLRNDEVNAVILSPEFASEMEELFEHDLAESDRITLEEWSERPLWQRIKELFGHLFTYTRLL